MDPDRLNEARITESWARNAAPWTDTVRQREIESRLVTDAAIVEVIRQRHPRTLLDIGCGEGWLARALSAHDIEVTGLDVVPELIDRAKEAGGGTFYVAAFEDIVAGRVTMAVDLAVCNFSLLGKETVERLLTALPLLVGPDGGLVVQTLHPVMACGEGPYRSGWREESWAGFKRQFCSAAPWYFRTLADWIELLRHSGWQLTRLCEPIHPETGKPVSLILTASAIDLRT